MLSVITAVALTCESKAAYAAVMAQPRQHDHNRSQLRDNWQYREYPRVKNYLVAVQPVVQRLTDRSRLPLQMKT
jgi:hypothetical protein